MEYGQRAVKGEDFTFSAQPLHVRSIQMCSSKLENSEEEKTNKLFPNSSTQLNWVSESEETQVHIAFCELLMLDLVCEQEEKDGCPVETPDVEMRWSFANLDFQMN